MIDGARAALVAELAARIAGLAVDRPRLVAVDGVDGAGKTVFGDELARAVESAGRAVVRASVDGFHRPRARRYRLGRDSPEGYYRDSYDYDALRAVLLTPLRDGGSRRVRRAVFDHVGDRPVDSPWEPMPDDAVLVFDGIFLHRPELRDEWDLSIFLEVSPTVSMARCAARDGTPPEVDAPSNRRYVGGQRIYFAEASPAKHASVVIDNNDLSHPVVVDVTG